MNNNNITTYYAHHKLDIITANKLDWEEDIIFINSKMIKQSDWTDCNKNWYIAGDLE